MHFGKITALCRTITPQRLFLIATLLLLLPLKGAAEGGIRKREAPKVLVGAEREELLLPLIREKKVGIVGNHTCTVDRMGTLLPERLQELGIEVVRLFSPEHGFRGVADAGETVKSGRDAKTGLEIVSLYGNKKKPSLQDLRGIDVLLFDLQDVGTRFYTYISTMHYAMEAAAALSIPIIVLDRPNPNDFVDGPLLESDCRSFIGMHRIPLLHGLTVGELALMINGEKWLNVPHGACNLTVIPIKGWQHGQTYSLPVAPSPNLRNSDAVRLYPSLCLFEASIMSVGRGTGAPFTCLGYPDKRFGRFTFTPKPNVGAKEPKHKGERCYGEDFRNALPEGGLDLSILIKYYRLANKLGYKLIDRERTFDLLAGNKQLANQLRRGDSEQAIRNSWQNDLRAYRTLRKKYLIYPEP